MTGLSASSDFSTMASRLSPGRLMRESGMCPRTRRRISACFSAPAENHSSTNLPTVVPASYDKLPPNRLLPYPGSFSKPGAFIALVVTFFTALPKSLGTGEIFPAPDQRISKATTYWRGRRIEHKRTDPLPQPERYNARHRIRGSLARYPGPDRHFLQRYRLSAWPEARDPDRERCGSSIAP